MAFFGVELKAGKPYSHRFDGERGRLHISHATLGIGSSTKKCFVQCNVGDKSPILLCSLTPDQTESCPLDLEFEEEEEVIFSVLGPRSVYLTGYYLGNGCNHGGDGDDSDSYGEDIAETESEQSSDYDSEEDEYEDDFIDDGDDDDDLEMFSASPKKSGVVIEEIIDEKPANGNVDRKRLKKKYHVSDSDGDDQKQLVVRGSNGPHLSESEDEDGLPINSHLKSKPSVKDAEAEEKPAKKGNKKKAEGGSDQVTGSKRKMDVITQDGELEKETEQPKDSSVASVQIEHESGEKPKKKKKKQRAKEAKDTGVGDDNRIDVPKQENSQAEEMTDNLEQDQAVRDEQDAKLSNGKNLDVNSDCNNDDAELKKKKKKKKKSKSQDSETITNREEVNKDSIVENKGKKEELKPSQVRTFSNGLVVEELQMGKPDGKRASAGTKVSVNYIGKLKKNGAIFDSNVGRAPFKFRLGVGEVIKGWDVGVNGMRIGDKRRITIPPSMGYGAKGAGGKIPPNAWLVFEVELVDVR